MSNSTRKATVTYLVQGETGGPIKIGRSTEENLTSRITSLQTGNPQRLRILKTMTGDFEAQLHMRFEHHRIGGEWFSPGADLLEFCGSSARRGEHADYRSGFEDGFRAAMLEMQVEMHKAFEWMEAPERLADAAKTAMDNLRDGS